MRKLGILLAVVLFGLMVFAQSNTVGTKADLEKVSLLEASVTELYDSIDGLNEILTGLAAQIGDTDYLLRKQIENIQKDFNSKLEEYAKNQQAYDERISAVETDILNIKNTIDTGLPALRDMLYELSDNLAALEERITSYVEVSLNALKEEMPNTDELMTALEDLKITLDIHDNDILKIYETLGTLSDQIAALEEKIIDPEAIETLTLKVDMHDQDIVNIYDNLSQKADREQIDELENVLDTVFNRIELLEEYANMIYDTLSIKADNERVDQIEAALENYATKEEVTKMLGDSEKKFDEKLANYAAKTDEKLNNVNMIAWLGVVIGAVAIVLPFVVK